MSIEGIDRLFRPRHVAVVGASRKEGSIGWEIVHNLLGYGFTGTFYPVNPRAESVHSVKTFSSVQDIPGEVDMAVLVVPKDHIMEVAEDCASKGVKSLVAITAGFRETGPEGASLENELVGLCKNRGMRLVGPNCMGLINASPEVRLNCTFAPTRPKPGGAAFVSQSGGLGVAILELMDELNMGLSKFISIGNRADVTDMELVEYLADDPETKIILLYLESFGDPRRLVEVGKRICRKKPVVVVKSGRTRSGAIAASSHTGALAASDDIVDDLLQQIGAVRADSMEELFDYASAFQGQPVPRGNRVGLVTNGGGPGIMAADACERNGLNVVEFSDITKKRLASLLPSFASVKNPVDLVATGKAEKYKDAVNIVLEDENVDSLLSIFIPPINSDPYEIARMVASAGSTTHKTVVGCFMGREDTLEGILNMETEEDIPSFMFPESAVKALAALYRRGRWLERGDGNLLELDLNVEQARNILSQAKAEGRTELLMTEAMDIVSIFGFRLPKYRLINRLEDCLDAARGIGYPVALKVVSPSISHKTEFGGVVIGITDETSLREVFNDMDSRLGEMNIRGYVVQEMVSGGRELILGLNRDPMFGPVLMVGIGGVLVEVLKDVSFRAVPVTDNDARDMLSSLRGAPLLEKFRGMDSVDRESIVKDIQRLSTMAVLLPEIKEMDINPLSLQEKSGGIVLDCRIDIS